jgi:hypothetical protein
LVVEAFLILCPARFLFFSDEVFHQFLDDQLVVSTFIKAALEDDAQVSVN